MDRSEVIQLIDFESFKNDYGIEEKQERKREVFVNVRSVSMSEFYEAGQNGLQPQYEFIMFAPDYNGEKVVEYKGRRYSVYRTYQRANDELELYVEDRAGV